MVGLSLKIECIVEMMGVGIPLFELEHTNLPLFFFDIVVVICSGISYSDGRSR